MAQSMLVACKCTDPGEVHLHMLDKAKDSPQAVGTLNLCILFAVALLVLVCRLERCNKISMFFSSVHLSLTALACTHSANYVWLACDLPQNWELRCHAEKAMLVKWWFMVLSENVESIALSAPALATSACRIAWQHSQHWRQRCMCVHWHFGQCSTLS